MIEGLRVYPAYQDARRRRIVISDCETCKRTQTMTTRQAIGCGYEPATPDARPWMPQSWDDGDRPTTCPGYTTALPAVAEIVEAHPQWKAGTLADYLDGARPTPAALTCLAVLDVGIDEFRADCQREALRPKAGA